LIVPKCGVSALRVIEKAAYFSITNTRNRISSGVLFVRETNKKPDGRNFTRCQYTKIERIFGRVVCRRTRRSNKWTGGRWNSSCGENRASSYGKGEYFWDGGRGAAKGLRETYSVIRRRTSSATRRRARLFIGRIVVGLKRRNRFIIVTSYISAMYGARRN